jgi:hypothetical protein
MLLNADDGAAVVNNVFWIVHAFKIEKRRGVQAETKVIKLVRALSSLY